MNLFNARGNARCPICRVVFSESKLLVCPTPEPSHAIDYERDWKPSAKTERLRVELHKMRTEDPTAKAIIFSQWTMVCALSLLFSLPVIWLMHVSCSQMLDLVEIMLAKETPRFNSLRLDG
jgi:hypothetical protein